VDYFGHVTEVQFGNAWREPPPLTEECLARVADLSRLRELRLDFIAAPASGLAQLRRLSKLKRFSFISLNRAEVDLAFVKGMTDLEELRLMYIPVTDRVLEHVSHLPRFERLIGEAQNVTDAGLRQLSRSKSLRALDLGGSKVTDLAPIRDLVNLESLILASTPITDAGLAPLAGFQRLKSLDLGRCLAIHDAGLAPLEHLTRLEELRLTRDSRITDAGLASIRNLKALTTLDLTSNPGDRSQPG
jgi:Leucine-rich repeat (LRR) protein